MAREPRVNAGVKSSAVLLFTNVGIFSCGSPAALLSLKLIFFSNWEEVAKKKKFHLILPWKYHHVIFLLRCHDVLLFQMPTSVAANAWEFWYCSSR